MQKRFLFLAAVATSNVGCMASLTPAGASVRPVTASQKDRDCDFITMVTASEEMGSSSGGDAQSALNKVRNKIAAAGGNAMLIVSTNTATYSTTVVAEALKCTFATDSMPATPSVSDTVSRSGGA